MGRLFPFRSLKWYTGSKALAVLRKTVSGTAWVVCRVGSMKRYRLFICLSRSPATLCYCRFAILIDCCISAAGGPTLSA